MNTARAEFPCWGGFVYEGLEGLAARRRALSYEAADGLEIPAYLTLPAEKRGTRLAVYCSPQAVRVPWTLPNSTVNPFNRGARDMPFTAAQLTGGSTTTQLSRTPVAVKWGRKCRPICRMGVRYSPNQGRSIRRVLHRRAPVMAVMAALAA